MSLEAVSILEELEVDIPIFLVLLDAVAEALNEDHTEPLGLSFNLVVESSEEVVFNLQSGADSVRELVDKQPSFIGMHVRQGVKCLHPMVEKHRGDNDGRDSSEQYGANQSTELADDHRHERMSTLRLR